MNKLFGLMKGPDLHAAVAKGEISDVRVLMQKGVSVDDQDQERQQTPLHIAASAGYDVILGELLDRKARSCVQDKAGNTPLHLAAAGGHLRCAQLLVSTRNSDQQRHMPLQLKNNDGLTPILLAAAAGHAAVVDLLLKSGVDMYSNVLQGRVTVGHLAARNGHVQVLGVLASQGFDLNYTTLDMTTLLHEAAQQGQVAAVTWLLRAGVNSGVKNFDGKTAQDLARAEQHHAVVQLLQQAAAAAAANGRGSSEGSSGGSTPTAAVAAAAGAGLGGNSVGAAPQQLAGQQQQQQWQVYPENERYKNYPSLHKAAV